MKNISKKKRIKNLILLYFRMHKGGFPYSFRGWEITAFCNKHKQQGEFKTYPDTVLRYMRELRDAGKINYETINRKKSLYEIK